MRNKSVIRQIFAAREQGRSDGIKFAAQNYAAAVMLCLKDKFDFTTEELIEAKCHINDIFDSVCEGYLTLEDISEVLKEENDITLQFVKANPQIKPDKERELLEEMNLREMKLEGINRRVDEETFKNQYLGLYNVSDTSIVTDEGQRIIKDQIVSVLKGYQGSKEDLERQIRKAGWLDE